MREDRPQGIVPDHHQGEFILKHTLPLAKMILLHIGVAPHPHTACRARTSPALAPSTPSPMTESSGSLLARWSSTALLFSLSSWLRWRDTTGAFWLTGRRARGRLLPSRAPSKAATEASSLSPQTMYELFCCSMLDARSFPLPSFSCDLILPDLPTHPSRVRSRIPVPCASVFLPDLQREDLRSFGSFVAPFHFSA